MSRAAAKAAGHDVTVPFTAGRTDATQDQTDVESFAVLEPRADGFRNYVRAGEKLPPETLLVDRAYLLNLSAPEMTVLVGGLRAIGAGVNGHGVFGETGALHAGFFTDLLAPGVEWRVGADEHVYEGRETGSDEVKWTAYRRRPGVRLELPAPRDRRGLRLRRRQGEVRTRLRGRLGQGHGNDRFDLHS